MSKNVSAKLCPVLINTVHIIGVGARAEFTLGNTAAILPQGVIYAFYSVVNVILRAMGD